jgi:hypothetical protein
MAFTNLFSNAFMLLTDRSNFIPTESSILHFDPYSINQGSGNYWLYGKDKTFYYHFLYDTETPYLFISTSNSCPDFDKNNFKTWCSAQKGNVD